MDGMTALEKIKQNFANMPVIMISGHGTIETAVQATRKGAFDFIEKPLSYDKIVLAITNGLRFARLEQENRLLRESSSRKHTSHREVGGDHVPEKADRDGGPDRCVGPDPGRPRHRQGTGRSDHPQPLPVHATSR